MEICIRCRARSDEVRLFDAIYEGRMSSICERCAIIDNVPIIKKPDVSQLRQSEAGEGVYNRMKRLAGLRESRKQDTFFVEDKLNELNKNPKLELPEKNKFSLIDHFHWEVMKNRRRRGLSQKQLAESIGESETAIQMIEKAKLPENAEKIIRKLEQFFQLNLRKVSEVEKIMMAKQKKPVLLDDKGHVLDKIPEEKIEIYEDEEESNGKDNNEVKCRTEDFDEGRKKMLCERFSEEGEDDEDLFEEEHKDFDIKKADLSSVTISDLRKIHKRKVEATRQEQIVEQRKIEERRRILEALREKDRIKYEKLRAQKMLEEQRKREEEKRIQEQKKLEEEKQKIINAKKEELRLIKEKESRDLDDYLGGMELLNKGKDDEDEFLNDLDRELI